MIYKNELLKIISNIAIDMERDVVSTKSKFLESKNQKGGIINYCEELFSKEFSSFEKIKSLLSKQKELPLNQNGELIITYVEIDNFDLINTNFSLGTIFGIYQGEIKANNLISVIYIAYGPSLEIVYSDENGVEYYKLLKGKLTYEGDLSLETKGKINSTAGDKRSWSKKHNEFVESIFKEGYRLRFSNSIVMDTHQILFKKGGIYTNPKTTKNPNGLISTLFEGLPISYVITKANGYAIDLKQNILDKDFTPDSTTELFFGSKYEIDKLKAKFKY